MAGLIVGSGLNLGTTGLSFGSGLTAGSGLIIVGINPPVLTLDTGPDDNTPQFTVSFDNTVQVGDISVLQWARNSSFTSFVDDTPTELDAGDITAGEITETIGPLADGVWFFRARITRGSESSPWSNVVSEDIDTGAPPSLKFNLATNSMYIPVLRFSIAALLTASLLANSFMGV
jgi:hypothetical protein